MVKLIFNHHKIDIGLLCQVRRPKSDPTHTQFVTCLRILTKIICIKLCRAPLKHMKGIQGISINVHAISI